MSHVLEINKLFLSYITFYNYINKTDTIWLRSLQIKIELLTCSCKAGSSVNFDIFYVDVAQFKMKVV